MARMPRSKTYIAPSEIDTIMQSLNVFATLLTKPDVNPRTLQSSARRVKINSGRVERAVKRMLDEVHGEARD